MEGLCFKAVSYPLPPLSLYVPCYLFGTYFHSLLEHAHKWPPIYPPLLICSPWFADKASAKDEMHLVDVSSMSEARAIPDGRGWKR